MTSISKTPPPPPKRISSAYKPNGNPLLVDTKIESSNDDSIDSLMNDINTLSFDDLVEKHTKSPLVESPNLSLSLDLNKNLSTENPNSLISKPDLNKSLPNENTENPSSPVSKLDLNKNLPENTENLGSPVSKPDLNKELPSELSENPSSPIAKPNLNKTLPREPNQSKNSISLLSELMEQESIGSFIKEDNSINENGSPILPKELTEADDVLSEELESPKKEKKSKKDKKSKKHKKSKSKSKSTKSPKTPKTPNSMKALKSPKSPSNPANIASPISPSNQSINTPNGSTISPIYSPNGSPLPNSSPLITTSPNPNLNLSLEQVNSQLQQLQQVLIPNIVQRTQQLTQQRMAYVNQINMIQKQPLTPELQQNSVQLYQMINNINQQLIVNQNQFNMAQQQIKQFQQIQQELSQNQQLSPITSKLITPITPNQNIPVSPKQTSPISPKQAPAINKRTHSMKNNLNNNKSPTESAPEPNIIVNDEGSNEKSKAESVKSSSAHSEPTKPDSVVLEYAKSPATDVSENNINYEAIDLNAIAKAALEEEEKASKSKNRKSKHGDKKRSKHLSTASGKLVNDESDERHSRSKSRNSMSSLPSQKHHSRSRSRSKSKTRSMFVDNKESSKLRNDIGKEMELESLKSPTQSISSVKEEKDKRKSDVSEKKENSKATAVKSPKLTAVSVPVSNNNAPPPPLPKRQVFTGDAAPLGAQQSPQQQPINPSSPPPQNMLSSPSQQPMQTLTLNRIPVQNNQMQQQKGRPVSYMAQGIQGSPLSLPRPVQPPYVRSGSAPPQATGPSVMVNGQPYMNSQVQHPSLMRPPPNNGPIIPNRMVSVTSASSPPQPLIPNRVVGLPQTQPGQPNQQGQPPKPPIPNRSASQMQTILPIIPDRIPGQPMPMGPPLQPGQPGQPGQPIPPQMRQGPMGPPGQPMPPMQGPMGPPGQPGQPMPPMPGPMGPPGQPGQPMQPMQGPMGQPGQPMPGQSMPPPMQGSPGQLIPPQPSVPAQLGKIESTSSSVTSFDTDADLEINETLSTNADAMNNISFTRRPTFKRVNNAPKSSIRLGGSNLAAFHKTLEAYRLNVKNASDPVLQFNYAKFLIDAANNEFQNDKKFREDLLEEGYRHLKKLSNNGYPEAQNYLATFYINDNDWDKALPLLVQAAKHNHGPSCFEVGRYYEKKRDNVKANQYYKKAASNNNTAGMHRLGVACLKGELGHRKDVKSAVKWFKRALNNQNMDSDCGKCAYEMARLCEIGYPPVVYQDHDYALELYVQGAELQDVQSQYKLGEAFERGLLGCPMDAAQSIHWYTVSSDGGDARAQFALCGWYLTGAPGVMDSNDQEAFRLCKLSAKQGYPKAEYALGYFYEMGIGVDADQKESHKWYKKAADHGDKRAKDKINGILISHKPSSNKKERRKYMDENQQDCIIA